MKFTTLLTTLALAATATATTAVVSDWRKEAADEASAGVESAALVMEVVGKCVAAGPHAHPNAVEAAAVYWGAAMTTSDKVYNLALDEVNLAGDKATRGQLEGLVIRAEAYYDTAKAYVDSMHPMVDAANTPGGTVSRQASANERMQNSLMLCSIMAKANSYQYEARTLLANFVEVNG